MRHFNHMEYTELLIITQQLSQQAYQLRCANRNQL